MKLFVVEHYREPCNIFQEVTNQALSRTGRDSVTKIVCITPFKYVEMNVCVNRGYLTLYLHKTSSLGFETVLQGLKLWITILKILARQMQIREELILLSCGLLTATASC